MQTKTAKHLQPINQYEERERERAEYQLDSHFLSSLYINTYTIEANDIIPHKEIRKQFKTKED